MTFNSGNFQSNLQADGQEHERLTFFISFPTVDCISTSYPQNPYELLNSAGSNCNMKVLPVRSRILFWIIVAMVYGFKLIGLAPFSVETATTHLAFAGSSRIRVFKHSKSGMIYNLLFAFSILACATFIAPHFPEKASTIGSSTPSVLIELITAGYRILFIFASCLSIMTWAFRQRKAAYILNRLLEIDVQLSGWNSPPMKKKSYRLVIVHLIISVCLWVSFWVIQFLHVSFHLFISAIIFHFPIGIVYFFTVEYFAVIGLIAKDIEIVNTKLMNSSETGYRLPNDHLSIINVASPRQIPLAPLKILISIRTILSELCEDVVDFFSLPILFCIASAFVPLSGLVYRFIIYVDSPNHDVIDVAGFAVFTITCILIAAYPMTSLAFNVTKIVQEAKRTRRIINKLVAKDGLMTREMKAELDLFSRWLADEYLDFTAFGLFTLDTSLLLSVLGTMTTYLVILIQFWSSGMDKN